MQSLANGTILGEYTLIRLIGRGGMGEVYEAHEAKLNRRVALKIIAPMQPDEHDQEDLFRRFIQEARTLAQVNHPNIVTIFNIDRIGSAQFIAMEYVPGLSVKQILKETSISTEEAIPIFAQILEGLTCLHDNHIIHRDLKPHNILVRKDGQVKILDFGIAKQMLPGLGEGTSAGVIAGTLPYMAPEVRIGEPAHSGSDIYSLGAIFYEILVGRPLARAKMDFAESVEVPYTAENLVRVPEGMRAIINKMCAHDPKRRYSRTTQVMEDIKKFRQSRPPAPPEVYDSFVKKIATLTAEQIREAGGEASFTSARVSPMPTDLRVANERRKLKRKRRNPYQDYIPHATLGLIAVSLALIWWTLGNPSAGGKRASLPLVTPAPVPAPQPVMPNRFTPPPQPVATPTPQTPPQKLALMEPKDLSVLWLDSNDVPSFSWSLPVSAKDYSVQIATDPQFKRLVIASAANGNSFRPEEVMKEGIYHWRLNPRQSWAPTIGPQKFILAYLRPVELVTPRPGTTADLKPKAEAASFNFAWKCKLGTQSYSVEVAKTSDFSSAVFQESVTACHLKNVALPEGEYYWRVGFRPTANHNTIWSDGRGLMVRAAPAPTPSPALKPKAKEHLDSPKLKSTLIQFTMAFNGQPRDLASLHKNIVSAPVLRWTPVRGAQSYQVQFSLSKDFTELLSEEKTSTARFEWKYVLPGKTFWRVRALTASGVAGKFSARGLVVASLPAPVLDSSYNFNEPKTGDDPAQIKWPAVPLADKYLVRIGPTRNLAKVEDEEISAPTLSLDPKPGRYFVSVAAADANGDAISAYSKPASVVVEAAFSLGVAKNMKPGNGARAPASDGKISVKFSWTEVPQAEFYSVEIASDPEFSKILQKLRTNQAYYLLKQAELKGRIYWRVRPENSKGNGEWSSPTHFDVR